MPTVIAPAVYAAVADALGLNTERRIPLPGPASTGTPLNRIVTLDPGMAGASKRLGFMPPIKRSSKIVDHQVLYPLRHVGDCPRRTTDETLVTPSLSGSRPSPGRWPWRGRMVV